MCCSARDLRMQKPLSSRTGCPESCGCPIRGNSQGQVGWGPGQPNPVGGNQPMAGSWDWMGFKVPSNPNHSVILWFSSEYKFLIEIISKISGFINSFWLTVKSDMWTAADPLGIETAPHCGLNFRCSLLVVQTETYEGMGKCLFVIILYVYTTNNWKQKCICGSHPLRPCFHCLQLCQNKTKGRKIAAIITIHFCVCVFFSVFIKFFFLLKEARLTFISFLKVNIWKICIFFWQFKINCINQIEFELKENLHWRTSFHPIV